VGQETYSNKTNPKEKENKEKMRRWKDQNQNIRIKGANNRAYSCERPLWYEIITEIFSTVSPHLPSPNPPPQREKQTNKKPLDGEKHTRRSGKVFFFFSLELFFSLGSYFNFNPLTGRLPNRAQSGRYGEEPA
jgi:hypothetical protein